MRSEEQANRAYSSLGERAAPHAFSVLFLDVQPRASFAKRTRPGLSCLALAVRIRAILKPSEQSWQVDYEHALLNGRAARFCFSVHFHRRHSREPRCADGLDLLASLRTRSKAA